MLIFHHFFFFRAYFAYFSRTFRRNLEFHVAFARFFHMVLQAFENSKQNSSYTFVKNNISRTRELFSTIALNPFLWIKVEKIRVFNRLFRDFIPTAGCWFFPREWKFPENLTFPKESESFPCVFKELPKVFPAKTPRIFISPNISSAVCYILIYNIRKKTRSEFADSYVCSIKFRVTHSSHSPYLCYCYKF